MCLLDTRPSLAMTWAGMSRHQMTVRLAIQAAPVVPKVTPVPSAMASAGRLVIVAMAAANGAEAGPSELEFEPQAVCGRAREGQGHRVVGLGEVHDALVVPEVHRQQLRMAVDAQARR